MRAEYYKDLEVFASCSYFEAAAFGRWFDGRQDILDATSLGSGDHPTWSRVGKQDSLG